MHYYIISILILAIGVAGRNDDSFTVTHITKPFWTLELHADEKPLCRLVPLAHRLDYFLTKPQRPLNTALTSLSCLTGHVRYSNAGEMQINVSKLGVTLTKHNYDSSILDERKLKIKKIFVEEPNNVDSLVVIKLEEAVELEYLKPLVVSINSVSKATQCELATWMTNDIENFQAVSLRFRKINESLIIRDKRIYPSNVGFAKELTKYEIQEGTPMICRINGFEVLTAFSEVDLYHVRISMIFHIMCTNQIQEFSKYQGVCMIGLTIVKSYTLLLWPIKSAGFGRYQSDRHHQLHRSRFDM